MSGSSKRKTAIPASAKRRSPTLARSAVSSHWTAPARRVLIRCLRQSILPDTPEGREQAADRWSKLPEESRDKLLRVAASAMDAWPDRPTPHVAHASRRTGSTRSVRRSKGALGRPDVPEPR